MGQSWTGGLAQGCAPVFQPFGEPGEISGRDIIINTYDIIDTFINSNHPQYSGALCLIDVLLDFRCFTCSVFINTSHHPYKSGTQQQADIHQVISSVRHAHEKGQFFSTFTNNFNATHRNWTISTYKCSRQSLYEKLGKTSRTVDSELESQIEVP